MEWDSGRVVLSPAAGVCGAIWGVAAGPIRSKFYPLPAQDAVGGSARGLLRPVDSGDGCRLCRRRRGAWGRRLMRAVRYRGRDEQATWAPLPGRLTNLCHAAAGGKSGPFQRCSPLTRDRGPAVPVLSAHPPGLRCGIPRGSPLQASPGTTFLILFPCFIYSILVFGGVSPAWWTITTPVNYSVIYCREMACADKSVAGTRKVVRRAHLGVERCDWATYRTTYLYVTAYGDLKKS